MEEVSDEIIFETPFDELSEIITSPADTGEQVRDWLDKFAAAKASSQAAKERAEAARNMSPQITALYYDAASGTMKSFDPTKNTQEEMPLATARKYRRLLISIESSSSQCTQKCFAFFRSSAFAEYMYI